MVGLLCALALACLPEASQAGAASDAGSAAAMLADAQRLFYTARFDDAAERTRALLRADPGNLEALEVQASVLHFELKRLTKDAKDKKAALAACERCRALLTECLDTVTRGQAIARQRLQANPADTEARFLLGKINLTYVWLQLSTLDRKTGWDQYWEARRSLEAVLMTDPTHIRARVAYAWVDFIVGTRAPWGTRWMVGGGNKGRALRAIREAATVEAEPFVKAEAVFGLWEMETRDGNREAAVAAARRLLEWFPENKDLREFVEAPPRPSAR